MSSKKDKLLENAQKLILKGQLDRAIKEYEQIVAIDPNDIRHRQRLAELMVRVNRKHDAIGEYEAIGKYYADNSYYLKAIAVYKQIQKLDPDNIQISLKLAVLNENQELSGNALAEYSRIYSHYEKMGRHSEALSILESMLAIEPDNLNTRLKFAETRFASGSKEQAFEDFIRVALKLKEQGDQRAFNQVGERIAHLFPGKYDLALRVASSQLDKGDAASALAALQEITRENKGDLPAWQLLAKAMRATGEGEGAKAVLRNAARLFPGELSPLEALIQCTVEDGDIDGAISLLKAHQSLFVEKGSSTSIEQVYLSLLELMPEDKRLMLGLNELYEASGEQAKVSMIAEEMEVAGEEEEPKELEVDLSEDAPSAEEAVRPVVETPPAAEVVPPGEVALEMELSDSELVDLAELHSQEGEEELVAEEEVHGELHLDLAEEEYLYGEQEEMAGAVQPLSSPPGFAAAEVVPAGELALEMELSDSELVDLAELHSQEGEEELVPENEEVHGELHLDLAEEEYLYGEQEEMAGAVQPLSGPPGFAAPEVQVPEEIPADFHSMREDDLVELEVEMYAEMEAIEAAPADDFEDSFPEEGSDQFDEEDTETHFNLGIAFKEMGRYDKAIAEFLAAAANPRRKVDSLTLQGVCCRDKGDPAGAEEIFLRGLALQGLSAEEYASIEYELAVLYESEGREWDALLLFREIDAVRPGFRDTAEKIAGFEGEGEDEEELDLVELDG